MAAITVIGGGVSGLTTAICLQQDGHNVHIITRDHPQSTTSKAAGAVWYGHGDGQIQTWATVSLKRFMDMADAGDQGVLWLTLREVFSETVETPYFAHMLPHFERIDRAELPAGYVDGFLMRVPLVESPRYLAHLLHIFEADGGTWEQREVRSLTDADGDFIVNCSGVWAQMLANDPTVYPRRGQVAVIKNPAITQGFMDDITFTYVYPRNDGVVLGGVAEDHDWNTEPDEHITQEIIERCRKFEPAIGEAPQIEHVFVGLRPYRDTVRLEAEQIDGKTIIHNYGHGGIGYTLSWGCAEDIAALVTELVNTPDT